MKGLVKNHEALLRKSKAKTPISRAVLGRIKEFESATIIDATKAAQLRNSLKQKNYGPLVVKTTYRELDKAKEIFEMKAREPAKDDNLSAKTAGSITEVKSTEKTSTSSQHQWNEGSESLGMDDSSRASSGMNPSKHISWEDQSATTAPSLPNASTGDSSCWETVSKDSATLEMKESCLESTAISSKSILDLSRETTMPFGADAIQQLFVEMCFYARLGFKQPPCCLSCTYREGVKKSVRLHNCPRWVVWRKDVNINLHPSYLDGNLVVMRCSAAQSLSNGESLDGSSWFPQEGTLECGQQ